MITEKSVGHIAAGTVYEGREDTLIVDFKKFERARRVGSMNMYQWGATFLPRGHAAVIMENYSELLELTK